MASMNISEAITLIFFVGAYWGAVLTALFLMGAFIYYLITEHYEPFKVGLVVFAILTLAATTTFVLDPFLQDRMGKYTLCAKVLDVLE